MPYLKDRIDALKAEVVNQRIVKDNSPPPCERTA